MFRRPTGLILFVVVGLRSPDGFSVSDGHFYFTLWCGLVLRHDKRETMRGLLRFLSYVPESSARLFLVFAGVMARSVTNRVSATVQGSPSARTCVSVSDGHLYCYALVSRRDI